MSVDNIEITKQLLQNLPDKYQKNVGELAWDFMRSISYALEGIWAKITYILGWKDLSTLNFEDMKRLVFQLRGIVAKTAQKATGELVLTGTGTVTAGDIFKTPAGLEFESLETVTVSEKATIKAQCSSAGEAGNVPAEQITVSTLQNFSVTNPAPFSGGYDDETKEELWARYLEDVQNPVVSGNIAHYRKDILTVSGVGKCKIKPLWNGDNTVKAVLSGSDGTPAAKSVVDAVQQLVDPYTLKEDGTKSGWGCGNGTAPIGAYFTAAAATAKNLTVAAKITYAPGYAKDTVNAAVSAAIKAYLKKIAFEQTFVSYAKIGEAIISAEGVTDYANLTLNGATANVTVEDTDTDAEIAVLSTLTLTED